MDPALWELTESGSENDEVSVIIRLEDESRPPDDVRIIARFGKVVTARLRRKNIRSVWESDLVTSVKASRPVAAPLPFDDDLFDVNGDAESVLDTSPPLAGPRTLKEDGTGVIVGVCDWGIDFTHPNLRNADGTTRLRTLWDQRGEGGTAPEPYGYGRVHTREEINAALAQPDPFAVLGYDLHGNDRGDRGSHGTHVCDIVAGNRRAPGSKVGLASGAEIVFVQLTSQRMDVLADFGDSVCLLEGLDFVRKAAGDRPCVINLSAGKTGGEHRGTNPFEQAVDAMLLERPNLALVQSVGNYANTAMHTHARLGPNQLHVIDWNISRHDRTSNELEIWYSGQDVFGLTLVSPQGDRFSARLGGRLRIERDGVHWGNLYHRRGEPNSGLNHIDIFLKTTAPHGRWRVELRGDEVVDGRLHAWIERDAGGRHQSRFSPEQATSSYTTNTICNSLRAIAVGAYDATHPARAPTRFSSRGPTADGRQKPEIAAPGYRIRAARSMPSTGWRAGESTLTVKSGTSMASPHVAGTVALMYQAAARPLTINEVRRVLIGTADPHPGPPGRSSTQLGYGYLNTEAAVAAVHRLNAEQPEPATDRTAVRQEALDDEPSYHHHDEQTEWDDEHLGDEDFGDRALADEDFAAHEHDDETEGPEDLADEGWGVDASAGTIAAEAIASPDRDPAGGSFAGAFAPEVDELGIDAEAAFRPRSDRRARGYEDLPPDGSADR